MIHQGKSSGDLTLKVVLFCGGLGTRLREHSNTIPKPLVSVGPRPILWHLMRYYAHFGHREFILCLGFGGELIREYFLAYNPYVTGEVTIGPHVTKVGSSESDISDWQITMVDTGLHANLGERLLAVRHLLEHEDMFLANYSDQLSDLNLDDYHKAFLASNAQVGFLSVRPGQSYHYVEAAPNGIVKALQSAAKADQWINGGYFVCKRGIFEHIEPGEELVEEPFARLAATNMLWTTRYEGFWQSMDTYKDKIKLDRMWGQRETPWQVWCDPKE
jgi:glucose-1-phosphate cytidylyltransferase